MSYLLDTNIISALINFNERNIESINNANRIKSIWNEKIAANEDVYISGIAYYEIKRGLLADKATKKIELYKNICRLLDDILLLDDLAIFDKASEIWADLKSKGKPLGNKDGGDADILIGATAIINNLIVVSDNVRHFKKIEGVSLENWLRE